MPLTRARSAFVTASTLAFLALATAPASELPAGEAKWTKVSRSKLSAYKRIVDVLW